ncbi:MAG: heme lyase CcmF/NrfE family subunit [Chloroflexi bacterium]|nr:heme lyase CcmF/NrfE family subunit [Chloroflexota bacterium]
MPTYLRVTALWGGQAGSLLFWTWLLATFISAAMLRNWKAERNMMPYVIGASAGTLLFFLLLVAFWENPFARYWQAPNGEVVAALFSQNNLLASISGVFSGWGERLPGMLGIVFGGIQPLAPPEGSFLLTPADGQGLNPLLRHPGMIIHPPMLYIGFVGFVVPYSFAIGALATGEVSDSWIRATRRWTLVAWLFLSLGLILGGWWAYDVLGWGGYWAWDPVENAAFMPWLTGTAFLHSVLIQEKRGMLKRWNMVLVISTYLLVILGTFATRSGIVSSVHSFARSAIGPLFFIFLAGALVISVALLVNRWEALKSEHELDSLLSRESLFMVNNFLFVSIMITVGIGTYWPVFTELLSTVSDVEKSSLGAAFYNQTTGPMFFALILIMGIAPLVAWKRASFKRLGSSILWPTLVTVVVMVVLAVFGVRNPLALVGLTISIWAGTITLFEYYRGAQARMRAHDENVFVAMWTLLGRNRRRYGGYMIHLGVVIMAIGILASSVYQLETQQPVSAGQTITIGDYVLEYETLERYVATDGRAVTQAQVNVFRNGREVGHMVPRIDNYPSGQPMSIPGKIMSPLGDDFYVLLVSWEQLSLSSATFKVYVNPLVNWVWGGGFVFIIGTLIAAWPNLNTAPSTERRMDQTVVQPPRRAAPAAGD